MSRLAEQQQKVLKQKQDAEKMEAEREAERKRQEATKRQMKLEDLKVGQLYILFVFSVICVILCTSIVDCLQYLFNLCMLIYLSFFPFSYLSFSLFHYLSFSFIISLSSLSIFPLALPYLSLSLSLSSSLSLYHSLLKLFVFLLFFLFRLVQFQLFTMLVFPLYKHTYIDILNSCLHTPDGAINQLRSLSANPYQIFRRIKLTSKLNSRQQFYVQCVVCHVQQLL